MVISKLIYSFSLILFGLLVGYAIQRFAGPSLNRLSLSTEALRKWLQRTALLFVNPVAILGAVWVVKIHDIGLAALPFTCLFALVAGGTWALLGSRILGHDPQKTGAMFCCGAFTNNGSIGALVCFMFLGEPGFALVPIYKLFEEFSYYSVGFPVARYYSGSAAMGGGAWRRIMRLAGDPLILVSVLSLALGGILNASGLRRPAFYETVNAVFIPLGTVMLLISIGLAFRFRRVQGYLKEGLTIAAIKFVMVPVLVSSLAWVIGFGDIEGGLPLKVVIILSSMPVAFTALIPPSIYDLDIDLANSCWFITTAMLAIVLPSLLFVIHLF
jgi:predicted permease